MTISNIAKLSTSIVALAVMSPATMVGAQENPDERRDNIFTLEEVVVKARKKEESLQDAPLAITAVTGDDLKFKNIESGESLGQTVPNLSFSSQSPSSGSNATSQVFIRGIGQTDFLPTTEPGVGVYMDGVYLARSTGSLFDFNDIRQVEVLRGPQGTLFGRNTIGGAVLVSSNMPTEDFEGGVDVTVGSDNRMDISGFLNVPVSDTLGARFSFLRKKRDGYVTRISDGQDLGDDDVWSGRAVVQWAPSDLVEFTFIGDYTKEDENGSPMVFNSIGTGSANAFNAYASVVAGCPGAVFLPGGPSRTVPNTADSRCGNNQWARGPFETAATFPTASLFEGYGLNLTSEWDLGAAKFKTITAYRDSEYSTSTDADGTPLDIFDRTNDGYQNQFSQEIQLSGEFMDGRIDWIVGGFYFKENAEDVNVVRFAGGGFEGPANLAINNLDPLNPQSGSGGLGVESLGGKVENKNKALFAQTTIDITEELHLTLGVRWTDEDKAFRPEMLILEDVLQGSQGAFIEAGCYLAPYDLDPNDSFADSVDDWRSIFTTTSFGPFIEVSKATGCVTDPNDLVTQRTNETQTKPSVNLAYDFTDDVMGYVSYNEGFKAGGFSSRIISVGPGARPFNSEFATTYEAGFKATLADSRLRVNAAAFQTNFRDIQIVIRQDFNPIVFNAGDATIKGVEVEFDALLSDNFIITGGMGLVDASYNELNANVIAAGVALDNKLPHTPRFTGNFSAAYNFTPDNIAATFVPRVDVYHRSKIYFDANNTEAIASDGFTTVNLSLGVELDNYPVIFNLGVTNLTDEIYRTSGNQSLSSAASYGESSYARPREWYLRVGYSF